MPVYVVYRFKIVYVYHQKRDRFFSDRLIVLVKIFSDLIEEHIAEQQTCQSVFHETLFGQPVLPELGKVKVDKIGDDMRLLAFLRNTMLFVHVYKSVQIVLGRRLFGPAVFFFIMSPYPVIPVDYRKYHHPGQVGILIIDVNAQTFIIDA